MKRGVQNHKEKVTMKTIAEEAGVTLTTVSRILNRKGGKYADSTVEKIFEIADRLKYRPNALVHGMQSGETRTAGVMVPVSSWFYAQIVDGIHTVFLENNVIMLLGWNPKSKHDKDDQQERHIIHQLVDRRVDGVILRPGSEEMERSYFEEIWEREIPLIIVDREMLQVSADFVGTDDTKLGREAAKYLIELGHRQLLFVGDSADVSTSRHREEGFRQVLSESAGASCRAINYGDGEEAEAVARLLRSKDRPTAIFCYNDPMAEYVGGMLREAGLSVPGDVSLLGAGNQASGNFPVPISTFDQHPRQIGAAAAQIYLDRAYGPKSSGRRLELIPADLLVRATTAAPSS
jgi:DNA-binding LacI/PurR family transcriptional regulator